MLKRDLMGLRFGRLVVTEEVGVNKWGNTLWKCRCDCGEEVIRPGGVLTRGDTRSCGCLGKENLEKLKTNKYKFNEYRTVGDIVYVELGRGGNTMMCNKSDWEKLKQYYWSEETTGYARSRVGFFHKMICDAPKGLVVDHINRNKLDNRRSNLRVTTHQFNILNNSAVGVTWHKAANKWMAQITVNGKHISLGLFEEKEDAIRARRKYRESLGIND